MKKSYYAIIAITIVIIAGLIWGFGFNQDNSKDLYKTTTNSDLARNFPVLTNLKYMNYPVTGDIDENVINPDEAYALTKGKLNYTFDKNNLEKTGFYCGNSNTKATQTKYSQTETTDSEILGMDNSIYVLECNDYYWVLQEADFGMSLYGPFEYVDY
jgi:hypothetical protein